MYLIESINLDQEPNIINDIMEKTHGGKRPNSGAKPKYGEPTKIVTFRIPKSKIPDVKKLISDYLKTLSDQKD